MKEMDRRSVITGIHMWCCRGHVRFDRHPQSREIFAVGCCQGGAAKPQALVEEARVTVHVHPRRRHRGRHWRCWWKRGRRVCGWRW